MIDARPFHDRDDEAVVALYRRLHASDPSIDAPDLARWRAFRDLAVFAGGRDFRVVERDGTVVALMTVGSLPHREGGVVRRVRIFVDPAARRAGLATSLLEGCEADSRDLGVRALEGFVDLRWTAGRAFAEKHGFSVLVHDLFLDRDASAFEAAAPAGVTIRPYRDGDDSVWAALFNATLSTDAGFTPETAESLASYARVPGFSLWVAESGDPVGFCHVEARERVGFVHSLGVLSAHEGRGIGAALLARGTDTLRRAGVGRIELCTEKQNARAQRLYARAGFVLAREAFTYRKNLSAR